MYFLINYCAEMFFRKYLVKIACAILLYLLYLLKYNVLPVKTYKLFFIVRVYGVQNISNYKKE